MAGHDGGDCGRKGEWLAMMEGIVDGSERGSNDRSIRKGR